MKSEYTFRASWLDGVEELNDKEELNLRRWIDDYALRRVEPDPAEIAASRALLRLKWEAIFRELNISRIRSENGKKGGAPKGNQNAAGKRVKTDQNKQKQAKNKLNPESKNKQKQAKNNQNFEEADQNKQKQAKNKLNPESKNKQKQAKNNQNFEEADQNKQKQAKNNQNFEEADQNKQKQAKNKLNQAKYEPKLPSPRARAIDTTIINEVNIKEKTHISGACPSDAYVCVREPEGSNEALAKLEDEFARYIGWLRKEHPYYANPENCEVLTLFQWHRLRQDFDLETIARATEDLDARADYKRRGQVGSHFAYLRSFCENIKTKSKR